MTYLLFLQLGQSLFFMQPLCELFSPVAFRLFLPSHGQIEHVEGVVDQIVFDFLVQRAVRSKRRKMVNFEEVRFQCMVDHYVYAHDLEADGVLEVIGLAGAILVREGGLSRDGGLHGDVFDLVHHDFCRKILLVLLHVLQDRRKTPLVALVVIFALTLDKVSRRLVDRIVSQMHIQIVKVVLVWACVRFCGKSSDAFLIYIDAEGLHTVDEHIDS